MHQPVMVREVIEHLGLKPGYTVLDATIGLGGHSGEILKRIIPGGRLIGMDADGSAIKIAENNLSAYKSSFLLIRDNFRNMARRLADEGVRSLDAALFDLGISSYQLDEGQRGFSIKHDAKLDMRMDRESGISAHDVVNGYKEKDLYEIIRTFGEERFGKKIARRIVEARALKKIETTAELADIVHGAIGRARSGNIDSATRTFQAIRIAVNDELAAVEEGLKEAISMLNPGGIIGVISFHSLEDRIAKNLFRGYASLGILKVLTKKPLRASNDEMMKNPRARSARFRAAERMQ